MRLWNSKTEDGQDEVALRWNDIDTNSTHNEHTLANIVVGIMHIVLNLFKSCFNFTEIFCYIFIWKFTRHQAHVVLIFFLFVCFFGLFIFFVFMLRYLLKTDEPKLSKEEVN